MIDHTDDPYAATLARHALEFLDDAEDYVEQLWLLSTQPSAKKSEKEERLAAFRRIVHTLKGQGSSFGFTSITILSHRLEDYLDSHEQPEKWADGGVDMFLRAIDKIVAARVEPSESVLQALLDNLPSSSTKKHAEITILLVSGAKVIRHKIRRDLEYYGFRVITVSDAYDGLRYASRAHPSAVVWSATLDGTNGFEMIAAMEAMDSTRDIPNVLLTSFALTHERILALPRYIPVVKLGADTSKFIAKALTALELKESDPERVIRPS